MEQALREMLTEHDAELKRLDDNLKATKARHRNELETLVRFHLGLPANQ